MGYAGSVAGSHGAGIRKPGGKSMNRRNFMTRSLSAATADAASIQDEHASHSNQYHPGVALQGGQRRQNAQQPKLAPGRGSQIGGSFQTKQ